MADRKPRLRTIGMPFTFTCRGCQIPFNGIGTKTSEVFPDFSGPAFKSYYCRSCAGKINQGRPA